MLFLLNYYKAELIINRWIDVTIGPLVKKTKHSGTDRRRTLFLVKITTTLQS